MAATADEVAGGRLILGLGCGWYETEYDAFGYPFDHRVGRFEEALRIIVPLTRGERVTLRGQWTSMDDAVLLPPPRRTTLPILVAAKGERMLRLTARHADQWQTAWFGLPDERWTERHDGLLEACRAEKRDPATIELTVGVDVRKPGAAGRGRRSQPRARCGRARGRAGRLGGRGRGSRPARHGPAHPRDAGRRARGCPPLPRLRLRPGSRPSATPATGWPGVPWHRPLGCGVLSDCAFRTP